MYETIIPVTTISSIQQYDIAISTLQGYRDISLTLLAVASGSSFARIKIAALAGQTLLEDAEIGGTLGGGNNLMPITQFGLGTVNRLTFSIPSVDVGDETFQTHIDIVARRSGIEFRRFQNLVSFDKIRIYATGGSMENVVLWATGVSV